ncbi:helix-turn-helix transcriptional regulator [Paenibacillus sp. GCM10027629]|uniref:helix-turn-helix transcriptional regulator n=1 Tax=Paenibacillus sp. GCM10027629 TaxID=3273414 RepID=UPI00363F0B82
MLRAEQETSTRRVVLTLLKTRGGLLVSELAKSLQITEMAVRRHLNTLERDGLVRSTLVRQSIGRPSLVYELTELADNHFPKNYQNLLLELLQELEENHAEDPEAGQAMVNRLFEGRKAKLLRKYAPRMEGKDLNERLAELTEIQSTNGYMAELMQGEQGEYLLHEHNCPITQVAQVYQQACQCELALFKELLGTEVERTECLAKGGLRCTYRIHSSN